MIYSTLKDYMYDKLLGAESLGGGSTTSLYRKALETLPQNSKILDVGIGNGSCTVANLEIIQKKNLKITGIDIDSDYIAAAKQKILIANASDHISADIVDLLKIKGQKWDYVFFSESYPVIEHDLMSDLWKASLELLNPGGKIIMVHNLCDHPTFLFEYFKKKAKYLTLIDFGKTTTTTGFVEHLRQNNLRIRNKKVLFPMILDSYPENIKNSVMARVLAWITGTAPGSEWRNNNQWFFEIEKIN